jgi:L-rhamnose isomerase
MLGEITTLYLFLCITVDVVGNTFGNGEGEACMICIWVNDGVNEDVKIGVDVV